MSGMYYIKSLTNDKTLTRQDFSRHKRDLDFREFQYQGHREHFVGLTNQRILSDTAASVIAQLHYRQWLSKAFIDYALEYCNFAVQDLGFELSPFQSLIDRVNADLSNTMLILGCQTPKLFRSRVDIAAKLLKIFTPSFKVIFAGKNPKPQGGNVYVPNEAQEMFVYFESLVEDDQLLSKHKRHILDVEPSSYSTISNLQHLITGKYFDKDRSNRLFIVSSTYHLIRLAAIVVQSIQVLSSINIKEIILIGSEAIQNKNCTIRTDKNYVKSLAYEVLDHMFQYESVKSSVPRPE